VRKENGSLSVLLAGYLALTVLLALSMAAVGLSLVAKNRIQAVTDSAVLYGHDRAVKKGNPDRTKLQAAIATFLNQAPSAQALDIHSVQIQVLGAESQLQICARHSDPLGIALHSGVICKSASAKSFLVD
jgi:hypothetical protein